MGRIFLSRLDKYFKQGSLKKIKPQKDLAKKSLERAHFFLKEAADLIQIDKIDFAYLAIYNALFHTGRAFLYRDGIGERSHYALARYLEEKYTIPRKLDKKFLLLLDHLRDIRHETQYGFNRPNEGNQLSDYLKTTKEFLLVAKKMVTSQ